jgi:hypothetical protein
MPKEWSIALINPVQKKRQNELYRLQRNFTPKCDGKNCSQAAHSIQRNFM